MKKTIFAAALTVLMTAMSFAGDFDLSTMDSSRIAASKAVAVTAGQPVEGQQPATRKPNLAAAALDMTIKLPFKTISAKIAEMQMAKIKAIDPKAPILFRQGDHIAFSNVAVGYNGFEVEPTILLKPYFEGNNKLAIKVMKIEADIAFGPRAELDKDGLMEMVMTKITTGMLESMDAAFVTNKVALKAKDVLTFSYDRKSWTIHATVAPTFIAPLLPGLISNVSLTAFGFDNEGFALSVKTGSGASIANMPGYNLAMSDGLITNFLLKFTAGSDFTLIPGGKYDGGVKFRADGRMELAGKVHVVSMPLKPNVYFIVEMTPVLTADNTLSLRFDKITVEKAYGIGVPGFLNNWLQGTIIKNVVNVVTSNAELAKVMTSKQLDKKTVQLTLKNSAFLPSFANGAVIKKLKFGNGLMFLGFEL